METGSWERVNGVSWGKSIKPLEVVENKEYRCAHTNDEGGRMDSSLKLKAKSLNGERESACANSDMFGIYGVTVASAQKTSF